MSLPTPRTMSPSKVATFRKCALAFRFSAIDRLPESPTPQALKGTLVHRALERLFWNHEPGRRTPGAACGELGEAFSEPDTMAALAALELPEKAVTDLRRDAEQLVASYFSLENPDEVNFIGVELGLEANVGGVRLRGIIDRLDLTSTGELVITDYKTGRVPREGHEHGNFAGVHYYALLCERVLGRRPVHLRLMYLREPVTISVEPTAQSLAGLSRRTEAIWSAIERACASEDFRPKPSALCGWCSFQSLCPAWVGGIRAG